MKKKEMNVTICRTIMYRKGGYRIDYYVYLLLVTYVLLLCTTSTCSYARLVTEKTESSKDTTTTTTFLSMEEDSSRWDDFIPVRFRGRMKMECSGLSQSKEACLGNAGDVMKSVQRQNNAYGRSDPGHQCVWVRNVARKFCFRFVENV